MVFFIGCIIGLVLGLTGAGGSIVAVPLLMYFFDSSASEATGLSLGVVAASSLFGAINRILARQVLWIPVLVIGATGIVSAPIGRLLSTLVDDVILRYSFAALAMMIACRMTWQSWQLQDHASIMRVQLEGENTEQQLSQPEATVRPQWGFPDIPQLLAGGVLTGLVSGFFGVGGGFVIVPFLVQLYKVPMSLAVSSSLVVIAGISLSGFTTELLIRDIFADRLILLALGGIVGMAASTFVSRRVTGMTLQRIFSVILLLMAVLMLLKE